MNDLKHLLWIMIGALAAFLVPFIFSDVLKLHPDLYYLTYFGIIAAFFFTYTKHTGLYLEQIYSKRLVPGLALGLIFAAIMIHYALSRPGSPGLEGITLIWSVFWRGVFYGTVDGLLLTVFPWVVTWRAFNAEQRPLGQKVAVSLVAWMFILIMTTAYHLGYSDFRSSKIIQANIGNTIMSMPTLMSANPVGTPITHVALHITAVVHSPETDLFLPPHAAENTDLN